MKKPVKFEIHTFTWKQVLAMLVGYAVIYAFLDEIGRRTDAALNRDLDALDKVDAYLDPHNPEFDPPPSDEHILLARFNVTVQGDGYLVHDDPRLQGSAEAAQQVMLARQGLLLLENRTDGEFICSVWSRGDDPLQFHFQPVAADA